MSKNYTLLWPQVTSFANLHLTFNKAIRGKRPTLPSPTGNCARLRQDLLLVSPGWTDTISIQSVLYDRNESFKLSTSVRKGYNL